MKRLALLVATLTMTAITSSFSYAGEWKQDTNGWWWQNDDGSYPINCWQWLDGNKDGISECYFFGLDGGLFVDTTTPDGYTVNADGAWIVDDIVQTRVKEEDIKILNPSSDDIYVSKTATPRGYMEIEKKIKVNAILGIENVEIYMKDGILMGKYISSSSNNNIPKLAISHHLYYENGTERDVYYTKCLLKGLEFSLTSSDFNERVNSVDIVIREE